MKHTLTIERARWACANFNFHAVSDEFYANENHGSSELLNDLGAMCCLGFAMIAAGVEPMRIENCGTPEGITQFALEAAPHDDFLKLFVSLQSGIYGVEAWADTELSHDAVSLNDRQDLSLAEREDGLIKLFAKHDIELVFV